MDSSVFFIFAVVVVGTLLSFLFKFFFFALLFPLSGSCGEVVANLFIIYLFIYYFPTIKITQALHYTKM